MHYLFRIAAFSALLVSQSVVADQKLDDIRARVDAMFPSIEGELVAYAPMEGWVSIQKGSVVAYMSEDGRYLMQGDLIDLDMNVNLTEDSRNESRRNLISSVSDKDVIAFTPDHVRHSVSVFTDVDCTYCRRLHSQIDDYLAKGIEIRYLLYPRGGPASASWNTSEDVWCSPDRKSALTAAKLGRDFDTQSCNASEVSKHYKMGQDVGLTGTPAIVLPDGTLVSGWLPPDSLSQELDKIAAAN